MLKCLLWSIAALNAASIREHPHSQYSTTTQDLCCYVHALRLTFRFLYDSYPDYLFFFFSFFWSHQMLFPNWNICSFLNKQPLLFCFKSLFKLFPTLLKHPYPISVLKDEFLIPLSVACWFSGKERCWEEARFCNICWCSCCKSFCHGWFQSTNVRSLNAKLGRNGQ